MSGDGLERLPDSYQAGALWIRVDDKGVETVRARVVDVEWAGNEEDQWLFFRLRIERDTEWPERVGTHLRMTPDGIERAFGFLRREREPIA